MKKQCCIDTINKIEEFLKERTRTKCLTGEEMKKIQLLPLEWSDFKEELIGGKE